MKTYKDINTMAYYSDYVKRERDHVLVDVRTPMEFMQGHLPNAVNIPLNELPSRAQEVPGDMPVIVVCATGNRSRAGADYLLKSGAREVYNLAGGTLSWMRQGLNIER